MMATDEERREVARRLHDTVGRLIDMGELAEMLGFHRCPWSAGMLADRIADLIEPPRQCPHCHSDRHYCSIHEDMQAIDRDALLESANEMEQNSLTCDHCGSQVRPMSVFKYAQRIREACGVVE